MFFDWEEIFIWASPERNVSIEENKSSVISAEVGIYKKEEQIIDPLVKHENDKYLKWQNKYKVRMNPISGTFKKASYKNYLDFRKDFLELIELLLKEIEK